MLQSNPSNNPEKFLVFWFWICMLLLIGSASMYAGSGVGSYLYTKLFFAWFKICCSFNMETLLPNFFGQCVNNASKLFCVLEAVPVSYAAWVLRLLCIFVVYDSYVEDLIALLHVLILRLLPRKSYFPYTKNDKILDPVLCQIASIDLCLQRNHKSMAIYGKLVLLPQILLKLHQTW